MRLEQLDQLIQVVDCGSINKAAEKLYLSPSSLTSSIKSLEMELGYEVLFRSNKGIKLTKQGTEVYNRAKKICAEVVSLKSDVLTSQPRDHLLILNNYSLLARDTFLKTYMQYTDGAGIMRFKDCPFLQAVSEINMGLSQLGVVTIYSQIANMQKKYIQKHHLTYEKLYDVEIFVLLGPGNPFYTSEAEDITLEELQECNFITYVDEDSNAFWQELFLGGHKRMKVFVNSVETMTELLRRTPSYSIETYSLDLFRQTPYFRQMRFLRLRNTDTRCEYGIIRPRDVVLSPMEETFLTLLREEFAKLSQ